MDNQKNNPLHDPAKENKAESSVSSVVKVDENEPSSIDFSGIDTLANKDVGREKWYVTLGNSICETLLSFAMFLLSVLLDVLRALWQVVKGIFVGIYRGILAIGHYFRRLHRIWREGDAAVKASFFVSGVGNFARGQIVDGVIFCFVEVAFFLFMATSGANNIFNMIFLGPEIRAELFPQLPPLSRYASIEALILGLITVVVLILYLFVWNAGIKSAYDSYVITENYRFLAAKQDALHFVRNIEDFPTTYQVKEIVTKEGNARTELRFLSPGKLRKEMRDVYGFSPLSSLYISYIRPNRLNVKPDSALRLAWKRFYGKIYGKYVVLRDALLKGKWSGIFAKYLVWQPKKEVPARGFGPVEAELSAAINAHRHTYDKYNRYNPTVRDATNLLAVLDRPELLESAIFAEDEASRANNLPLVSRDEKKLKANVVASRVVCAFECSYEAAVSASKLYLKARQLSQKENRPTLEILAEETERRREKLQGFIAQYRDMTQASLRGMKKAYLSYGELRSVFDQGKTVFLDCCMGEYEMTRMDARRVYSDYGAAIRAKKDEEAEVASLLAQMGDRLDVLSANYDVSPLYGEPIRFKKKSKRYLDEKFAVTVLSLPVLGAAIVSVLPLFFSIVIAFTNYNKIGNVDNVSQGIFSWSMESFLGIMGLGKGESLLPVFMGVLGWTLTWAFFATFLNYIFGIVLALLINNKHIKLKKMWRTFFVISIAIPQFITLLVMSKIFGDYGPVANQFVRWGWIEKPNNFWLTDPSNHAFMPKLMLILINCWIGIPYTMLSTTGILMNIPEDLYESARIDGASPWKQFWKITMPYILFVTGPSLLTTFIGNINNFNVIFFLTGGGPSDPSMPVSLGAEAPQMTDLLITWLYRMTVNATNPKYGLGSVIGILIFLICSFFSLIAYKRLGSTQNEEAFQ